MPEEFTGNYWQLMGNTGKYDLHPGFFTLNI